MLISSDLAKDMAGEPLLRGVSFKLERRDRMTIAGRNGAGKTTLLRMLAGPDVGRRRRDRASRRARGSPCTTSARRASATSRCATTSCRAAPSRWSSRPSWRGSSRRWREGDERAMESYAGVQARFEAAGGYTWREGVTNVVHGLGFVDADLERQLSTFSGGELTRASLARVLASRPDLLLLDEPTNHLDIESLEWLEETLVGLDAAIVLVAHDRWFLEAVGTCVLEIEAGRSRFFKGPWHAWRREQAARELALGKAIAKPGGGDRADGALRRALLGEGDEGAPGAGPRQEAAEARGRAHHARPEGHARAGLPVQEARALGPRHLRARARAPGGRRPGRAAHAAARRRAVARARRARVARRA